MKKFFTLCAIVFGVMIFSKVKSAKEVVAKNLYVQPDDLTGEDSSCDGPGGWCCKLDTVVING